MKPIPVIIPLFGYDALAQTIAKTLGFELGSIHIHAYPDEEIVPTISTELKGKELILVGSLDHPNPKMAPLLFAAETARTLGATKVGWIAPYLPYMRQDKQFHPGEGITSAYFAKIISAHMDWMITIDPHLHRWHALSDIYSIPTQTLQATQAIAQWIKVHCTDPLLIGPDSESKQWVSSLAESLHAPYLISEKVRKGDSQVDISLPQIGTFQDRTPILVDDIISTAATMIGTVKQLQALSMKAPICIGVHGIFAGQAYEDLLKAGAQRIVTCNTIMHPSNAIDISPTIIEAITSL